MQTTSFPTTTTRELEIARLTGRRPARIRRATRRRLTLAAVIIVTAVAGIVGAVDADTGPLPTIEHRVRPGESLWVIADGLTPEGEDVRVTVRTVMDLNGLTDSALAVGQVLVLPAGY